MMTGLKIHLQGIKVALMSRMAYRGDFFISFLIMLAVESFSPLLTLLIYKNGASFPGWNMYEVLLIQGVFLLSRGVAFPFFFGMVWNTLGLVREGTFDILFIKPRSVLQMVIVTAFDSEDLGKLLGGILLFWLSLSHLPAPGLLEWLQFFLLFLVSLVVLFSFALLMAGSAIIWVGNGRIYEIFFAVSNFGQYPAAIFSKGFQTIITMIIPVALMGFIPASALLGKPSSGIVFTLLDSTAFLLLSLLFWNRMLGKYTSAGG